MTEKELRKYKREKQRQYRDKNYHPIRWWNGSYPRTLAGYICHEWRAAVEKYLTHL